MATVPAGPAGTAALLERLYAHRDSALLWSQAGRPTAQAVRVLTALDTADRFGLRPQDYEPRALRQELRALTGKPGVDPARWRAWDERLSRAVLALLHDLHFGRIDPRTAGFDMPVRHDVVNYETLLQRMATAGDPDSVLSAAEPDYLHYRLLRQALGRYRRLAARSSWKRLPPLHGRAVHEGEPYSGAAPLRARLALIGLLKADAASRQDAIMDPDLSAALKRFQFLHGLREDGTLGRETLAQLEVPLARRVTQIELTLERWRWLPPLLPPTLLVNIPAFRLFLIRSPVDRESDMLRMNVIVGREYPQRHTPVFAADMKAIVFRPYWDVPTSITRDELLPQIRTDPRILDREHLELVTRDARSQPVPPSARNLEALAAGQLRLRQRPGADNALGLIKFLLPNPYDVYLHSTPAQRLFEQPVRAFSHGCVRVSDPVALATVALQGTPGGWTADKVRAAMDGDVTFRVPLARPVHVLIVYGTAVATEDGDVHFYRDIYGYDARLERLLAVRSGSNATHPADPAHAQ